MLPAQEMKTFLATECIKFGWETFKKRPWFFIGALVMYFVASFFSGSISGFVSFFIGAAAGNATSCVVNFIVNFFLSSLLGIMYVAFLLKAHDDPEHVTFADAWKPTMYWPYVGVAILTTLAIIGGVILLIIPGIIFAIMFCFGGYLVVDRDMRPMDAMRESRRLTNGHKWELFLLVIASAGLMIIGVICLLVGFLVAWPVVSLAFVHAYRELQKSAAPASAPTPAI